MLFLISPNILLLFAIGAIALAGDNLLFLPHLDLLHRAVIDSVTHGLVGGLTWIVVTKAVMYPAILKAFDILLCAFLSSAIDVDHFIAARSFRLQDVQRLQSRPFLHCTSIPLTLCVLFIYTCYRCNYTSTLRYAWILFAAIVSHHIRDGVRRGLWLWPFGTTRPIPTAAYVLILMFLPYVITIGLIVTVGLHPRHVYKGSHLLQHI